MKKGIGGLVSIFGLSGCGINMPGPGGVIASQPNPTWLTEYIGENASEKMRGIAYTCKAGHIDIAHLKKFAEFSKVYKDRAELFLRQGKTNFTFSGNEPIKYYVNFDYPKDWNFLNKNQKLEKIEETSIRMGQYFSYLSSIGHEIITGFGWKRIWFVPEKQSSFTWEDGYSNALGCYLAGFAMRDKTKPFKESLNSYIDIEMKRLGVQPKDISKKAVLDVEVIWYKGDKVLMRNFDTGFLDGYITPNIAYSSECRNVDPVSCPIPTLKEVQKLGFNVNVNFKFNYGKDKLRQIFGEKEIYEPKDFIPMIEYLKKTL